MAATSEPDTALSKGDYLDTSTTEHVQNLDNQPLRRSERSSIFPNKYNEFVADSKEACKDQHWIEAVNKEMDVLYRNDTWDITELPKDRKSIGGKWVFKIKYKSNGEIERYKARYVANGYNQKEGIDYDETFFPVVKIVALSETIYMDLHEGFFSPDDTRVLYVDDIIVTGNNASEIENFKEILKTKFQIKDLGKLKYFLGIEFMHKPLRPYLKIALKVLRYLKGNPSKGIHIVNQRKASLEAFVDADWAKYLVTRKSVTRFCVKLNGSLVSSKSLAEAKYRVMASVTFEVTWILKILKDLEWDQVLP
ncbi:ribonuclease H-like domain-containing protein, partial [Tanacetum coccineum]